MASPRPFPIVVRYMAAAAVLAGMVVVATPLPVGERVLGAALLGACALLAAGEQERRRLRAAGEDAAKAATTASRVTASRLGLLEERVRCLYETADEGVWTLTPEGRTEEASQHLLSLLGVGELGQRTLFDLAAPGEEERLRATWARWLRGERTRSEHRLQRADGAGVDALLSASPLLDTQERLLGVLVVVTDVTARRQAERTLRATEARRAAQYETTRVLAEALDLPSAAAPLLRAVCTHLEWRVGAFWARDAASGLLRCVEVEPRRGDAFETTTRSLALGPGLDLPGRVVAAGAPLWVEDLARDPAFPRGPAAQAAGLGCAFAFPAVWKDEVVGVLEFFRPGTHAPDPALTEAFATLGSQIGQFLARQRAEDERAALLERERNARGEAEEANRAKDEFLATLSHELRTPLNAIVGWAHVLRASRPESDTLKRGLEVIERNARNQARLIEDVLDVSRIVAGKLQVTPTPVPLARVVEAAADTLRPVADARGVSLAAEIEAAGTVLGDPERLQQVVANLLGNALKFTPRGGRVDLRLRRVDGHAEVRVSDTGDGIDPEFLPQVFDRFRQADGSITRRHGGLGLGLAIVRSLVDLHGGQVTAESRGAGQGSTFVVRLPLVKDVATPTLELASSSSWGALAARPPDPPLAAPE